jgi:sugar/nucleoside kinase (ribokinase family)
MPFLMLGEALVGLICERPADGIGDATVFTPHFGGAAANVAVSAARAGGRPALGGGAGQDPWGQWPLARLRAEGVDTRWFSLDQGRQTPVAFATVTAQGEPAFAIYGEGISAAPVAFGERVDEAVESTDALVFASNTLVGPEREVTLRACVRGRPLCFDPSLRLERWPSQEDAVAAARGCLEGSVLVKANANGARLQATGWNHADPALHDALGAAAEAGACAAESWGAVA